MDVNSTNFSHEVEEYFKELLSQAGTDKDNGIFKALREYQYLTYNYFLNESIRGILVYYEMGYGKTIQALVISEHFIKTRPVYILASKTIHNGFITDLHKLLKALGDKRTDTEIQEYIEDKYSFITTNASNMTQQFSKVSKKNKKEDVVLANVEIDDMVFDDRLESLSSKDLDGSLVIIDEAHNLFNAITNNSKNAMMLYNAIMNAKDIKLLFLSGTPIINDPFEMVPCINMLHGYIDKKITLLPEYYADFNQYFVDRHQNQMLNRDKFMDRINGKIMYYGSYKIRKNLLVDMSIIHVVKPNISTTDPKYNKVLIKMEGFPDKLKTVIKRIPMSMEQYKAYSATRKMERSEDSNFQKTAYTEHRILAKNTMMSTSTYRVKSRLLGDFLLPEDKSFNKKYVQNLSVYSPKYDEIIFNITQGVKEAKKSIHVIYSNFVSNNGLYALEQALQSVGIKEVDEYTLDSKEKSKVETYAKITGNIDPEIRTKIIKVINCKENYEGKVIKYLLISPTGVEGVNILTARHFHYVDPHWNFKTFEQAEARIYRYGALTHMPIKDRWVQSHIYLSTYPEGIPTEVKLAEPTTDEELFFRSIKNKNLSNQFLQCMVESSVNCVISHPDIKLDKDYLDIDCRRCIPNDRKLYITEISKDMDIPTPCVDRTEEEVDVKELIMNKKKYYYTDAPINKVRIFIEDKNLGTYIDLIRGSLEFKKILKHIY